jgi:hypothetical protein
MTVTQINEFFHDEYVNMTCSFCVGGQANWVLHDGQEWHLLACNRCLEQARRRLHIRESAS